MDTRTFFKYMEIQKKAINDLIKKHGLKYRHGSIIDYGKGTLVPAEIKKQITAIQIEMAEVKGKFFASYGTNEKEFKEFLTHKNILNDKTNR